MSDNLEKFSEALRLLSSNSRPKRELVYDAYVNHLKDVELSELPPKIKIIFESVVLRLTSVVPPGDIGNDEAGYLADDILYMAKVLQSQKES